MSLKVGVMKLFMIVFVLFGLFLIYKIGFFIGNLL